MNLILTTILTLIAAESFNGPLIGYEEYLEEYAEDAAFRDAEPYCRLNEISTCTTRITSKLCSVELIFSNGCESVIAQSENCLQNVEGQKCTKKLIKGKIKQIQGFHNAKDMHARGFKILTENGLVNRYGYTPSKVIRQMLRSKAAADEIEESEIINATNWQAIKGHITGIRYDSDGALHFFNLRTVSEKQHIQSLQEQCAARNETRCSPEVRRKYPTCHEVYMEAGCQNYLPECDEYS